MTTFYPGQGKDPRSRSAILGEVGGAKAVIRASFTYSQYLASVDYCFVFDVDLNCGS